VRRQGGALWAVIGQLMERDAFNTLFWQRRLLFSRRLARRAASPRGGEERLLHCFLVKNPGLKGSLGNQIRFFYGITSKNPFRFQMLLHCHHSLKNHFIKEFFKEPIQVVSKNLKHMVLEGNMSGSSKNLSNWGSLKYHVIKEFFEEPLKVSQRNFTNGSFRPHFWFLKETFQLGVLKEPCP